MIQAGVPDKYSFHMQVSARPIASCFDPDRLVLKLPALLAFGAICQCLAASHLRLGSNDHLVHLRRSMSAITKALRSTMFITEGDTGTPKPPPSATAMPAYSNGICRGAVDRPRKWRTGPVASS
jgi:hypothetical protein